MIRSHIRRPSPSLVISLIALFVALGGTGYAAMSLPKNSVGSKQLKRKAVTNSKLASNAVTGSKVKNDALTGSDILESSLGKVPAATSADRANSATHATSADSATNATHATSADSAPVPSVLAAGQTLRGTYAMRGDASGTTNDTAASAISFAVPLSAAPTVHIITLAAATPAGCTGNAANPGADPGNLCVFEGFAFNATALQTCNPLGGATCMSGTATRFGAGVVAAAAGAGVFDEFGTWAATG
jgi:hypothetical protein